MDEMKTRGIQTSIHYPPVHSFSYYRAESGVPSLPVTEEIGAREVTLPLYPGMTPAEVESVVTAAAASLMMAMDRNFRPSVETLVPAV